MRLIGASSLNINKLLPKKIHPVVANVKLIENCNSRCITCDYWRRDYPAGLNTERSIQLLDEIYKINIRNVRFTGGETLLRKDFFEILKTRNQGDFHKIVLATNGLLLERFADQINDSIITNVTVSLDAIGENNDNIRGIKGYYNTAMRGLEKINKRKKIVSTVTKVLVNDLEDLILLCIEKGYDYDINLPNNNLYFCTSEEVKKTLRDLWPSQDDVNKTMEILAKYNILNDKLIQNASLYLTKGRFALSHCMLGYVEVDIESNGDVRTGCNVFGAIGNVNNSNLAEIISSKPYMNSVSRMYNFNCPVCACGYATSIVYENPLSSLSYTMKRLKRI